MTNKQLNAQFNIPAWVKGSTPAEEAKSIQKRFADRQDKASVETMEELLQAVADKQEYYKIQQGLASEATQVPDMMNGQTPEGMEQFAGGGTIFQNYNTDYTNNAIAAQKPSSGGGISMAGVGQAAGAASAVAGVFGDHTPVQYQEEETNKAGAAMGTAKDAVGAVIPMAGLFRGIEKGVVGIAKKTNGDEGAAISQSMFSPSDNIMKLSTDKELTGGERALGLAATIFAPGGAGQIIHKGNERRKAKSLGKDAMAQNQMYEDQDTAMGQIQNSAPMAYGGYSKQMAGGGFFNPNGAAYGAVQGLDDWITKMKLGKSATTDDGGGVAGMNTLKGNSPSTYTAPIQGGDNVWGQGPMTKPSFGDTGIGKATNKVANWTGNNYGSLMNLAPIVGNLTDRIDRAPNPRRDRATLQYDPNYVDERQLQRIAQQEHGAVANSLRDASGGSGARLSSNLLAAGLNKQKALSAAYMGSQAQNAQEDTKVYQSKAQNQALNLSQSNLDEADKQANEGAYQTAKSARRSAIFEDIGKVGMEEGNKKLVKEMFGYTWDGRYYRDSKGTIIPRNEKEKKAALQEVGKTNLFSAYKTPNTKLS